MCVTGRSILALYIRSDPQEAFYSSHKSSVYIKDLQLGHQLLTQTLNCQHTHCWRSFSHCVSMTEARLIKPEYLWMCRWLLLLKCQIFLILGQSWTIVIRREKRDLLCGCCNAKFFFFTFVCMYGLVALKRPLEKSRELSKISKIKKWGLIYLSFEIWRISVYIGL